MLRFLFRFRFHNTGLFSCCSRQSLAEQKLHLQLLSQSLAASSLAATAAITAAAPLPMDTTAAAGDTGPVR
jgi:hypothetical protein